jgi:hypothetical protein
MISFNPIKSIVGQIRRVSASIYLKYRLFRAKTIVSAEFKPPYWYIWHFKIVNGVTYITNSYKLYYDSSEKKYIAFDK